MHKYIISGGPGSGKTSLLKALQQKGNHVSKEVSRQLIKEEVAKGSSCLPWVNLPCFAQKALARMVQQHALASSKPEITFFDRGIPDIMAYLKAAGLPVDDVFKNAVQQYAYSPLVFLAPPWQEIYVNDSERWQTFEEAVILYHAIKDTYQSLRYTIVELPKVPVAKRVDFIASYI